MFTIILFTARVKKFALFHVFISHNLPLLWGIRNPPIQLFIRSKGELMLYKTMLLFELKEKIIYSPYKRTRKNNGKLMTTSRDIHESQISTQHLIGSNS